MVNQRLLADASGWAGNVFTSVAIVFVNKVVMSSFGGYGFHFSTCLSALHYITTTGALWASKRFGFFKSATMPFRDLVLFTIVSDLSIISLNLSLMVNTVSFYQISKLMTIPFVCVVELVWFGRAFSARVMAAVLVVVLGVAIVTLEDLRLEVGPLGVAIAAASVVSSGGQQLLVRRLQQKNGLASSELLSITSPAQAASLAIVGPLVDRMTSGDWVGGYALTPGALFLISISCLLAVLVNATQFACLGRFSALSYQVMGHSKTMLVLLGGAAFLGEVISGRKVLGMALAVAGMVSYGTASARDAAVKQFPGSAEGALRRPRSPVPGDAPGGGLKGGSPQDLESSRLLGRDLADAKGAANGYGGLSPKSGATYITGGEGSPKVGSRLDLIAGGGDARV